MMTDTDWWIDYMPTTNETMQAYLDRMLAMPEFADDDMHLVLMEHAPDDLAIIARGQHLLGTRHTFSPGRFCVMAIRDLVFCAYTAQWEAE